MKILIDGDACPKIPTIERIARQKCIPCHIYCDASRYIDSDYSEIHVVDIGSNSADMAIIKYCMNNDIVITNDTSLAAMALARNSFVLNSRGMEYTKENIMSLLTEKYIRQARTRKSGRKQFKPTRELFGKSAKASVSFAQALDELIIKASKEN